MNRRIWNTSAPLSNVSLPSVMATATRVSEGYPDRERFLVHGKVKTNDQHQAAPSKRVRSSQNRFFDKGLVPRAGSGLAHSSSVCSIRVLGGHHIWFRF